MRKVCRNRVIAEITSYESANGLVDKYLSSHNLKAFIFIHRILKTGIVRDVSQDFSIDMLKESLSSLVKGTRYSSKPQNQNRERIHQASSFTVCVKFSGQALSQYIYFFNCR